MTDKNQKRILIADDTEAIHQDIRKILQPKDEEDQYQKIRSQIFPNQKQKRGIENPQYLIDSAYKGEEAVELVERAMAENKPYMLGFIDVRMPPGKDGVKTIQEILRINPAIQIVIITAYSDYSWNEMCQELPITDNLLILKKPFDPIEILLITSALTKKWELEKQMVIYIDKLTQLGK
jgi:CheY-like chemotaxis protein